MDSPADGWPLPRAALLAMARSCGFAGGPLTNDSHEPRPCTHIKPLTLALLRSPLSVLATARCPPSRQAHKSTSGLTVDLVSTAGSQMIPRALNGLRKPVRAI